MDIVLTLQLINENAKAAIDDKIEQYLKKQSNREEIFSKYGKKAFLDPKQLKFPVVDPFTGQFHCALIYRAYMRAAWGASKPRKTNPKSYYLNIKNKARSIFNKAKCGEKLNIVLTEGQIMNYLDFIEEFVTVVELEEYNNVSKTS